MRGRNRRRREQSERDRQEQQRRARMSERLRYVFKRDLGMCHICGLPVPADFERNSPIAPSLDHLIPASHGGRDGYYNLALAHRICNETRATARTMDVDVEKCRERVLAIRLR